MCAARSASTDAAKSARADKEANPLSLDVLYAKVGAIEEGLASAANGSASAGVPEARAAPQAASEVCSARVSAQSRIML